MDKAIFILPYRIVPYHVSFLLLTSTIYIVIINFLTATPLEYNEIFMSHNV